MKKSWSMPTLLLLATLSLTALWPVARAQEAGQPAATAASPRGAPARAVFAGGCFWCVEAAYEGTPGVLDVVSGFAGGKVKNPSYERVTAGGTGHAEVVQVSYDPARISYAKLLEIFWRNIDPFDAGGQFCDRGDSYRAEVFVDGPEERRLAEATKADIEKRFGRPVATRISDAAPFYPAEAYHQDYHVKNPLRYKYYSTSCGRASRLAKIWGSSASGR